MQPGGKRRALIPPGAGYLSEGLEPQVRHGYCDHVDMSFGHQLHDEWLSQRSTVSSLQHQILPGCANMWRSASKSIDTLGSRLPYSTFLSDSRSQQASRSRRCQHTLRRGRCSIISRRACCLRCSWCASGGDSALDA